MRLKSTLLAVVATIAVVGQGAVAQGARGASGVDPKARVILITGSTDGLGREVARRAAATGAHVIVHGRNRERGLAVVEEIKSAGKGSAAFYPADLASLANVRAFADTILRHYPRIDVLVNNAGVWLREGPRQTSADGYEMTFAVNYLAGYLLTKMLLPRVMASAPSRIINVASQTQSPIDFTDVLQERTYAGQRAYSQSKLAQVMYTFDLARELEGKRVTVVALHPATLMDTHLVEAAGMSPRSTVDEGATALMHLIMDVNITHGAFYRGTIAGRANPQAYDEGARAQLKAVSEKLIGGK
ncbi:MAG: SDR family NAD(P)-dependent oxidoreductase [Phycisphaerae bacterium]|nr:SDR family NAD(P)-dependent oxidoreductase [Gemmatimonadaceae bacterium]